MQCSSTPLSSSLQEETHALRVDSVVQGNFKVWSSTPLSEPAAMSGSLPFTMDVVAKDFHASKQVQVFFGVSDPSSSKDVVSEDADRNDSFSDTFRGDSNHSGPYTSEP